jgi:hypothetical protein
VGWRVPSPVRGSRSGTFTVGARGNGRAGLFWRLDSGQAGKGGGDGPSVIRVERRAGGQYGAV